MKLALYLTSKAEADIDAHCAYIGRSSIEKALEFDAAVFRSLDELCEMPLLAPKEHLSIHNFSG